MTVTASGTVTLEHVNAISNRVADVHAVIVDAESAEANRTGDGDNLTRQAVRQHEDMHMSCRHHEHVVHAVDLVHSQAMNVQSFSRDRLAFQLCATEFIAVDEDAHEYTGLVVHVHRTCCG